MSSYKNYKIVQDPIYGRHLIAAKDIQPGESIIDEPPLVDGPVSNGNSIFTNETEHDVCPVCCQLLNEPDSHLCGKCELKFCSSSCSKDLLHTSQECQIVSALPSHPLKTLSRKTLYNLINVVRCLFTRIRSPLVKWPQVLQLESKVKALEKVGAFAELDPIFGQLKWEYFLRPSTFYSNSSIVEQPLSIEDNIQSAARHCLGVMRTNAFSLFTNTHAREGLYFLSSLMTHSCLMNTDRQTDHDTMVTRAAQEIKEGEPITTSYLSYLSGTPERFNETRTTWLFTCYCRRCIDPTECGTEMSTMACPSCHRITLRPNLGDCPNLRGNDSDEIIPKITLIWKCGTGNLNCNDDTIEQGQCISIQENLERVQKSRPRVNTKDISTVEEWLRKYDNGEFLSSNHFLLVQMKFYLCQYYGRNSEGMPGICGNKLEKKVKYCLQILDIFSKLFPGIYTFKGTILFELWCGLTEIKSRVENDQNLMDGFGTIDYTDVRIDQVRTDALTNLNYALTNSAEESMGLVLREHES